MAGFVVYPTCMILIHDRQQAWPGIGDDNRDQSMLYLKFLPGMYP